MPNCMSATLVKFRRQSNRHGGNPAGRPDAPAPNRTAGRSLLRSPPKGPAATGRAASASSSSAACKRETARAPIRMSMRGAADLGGAHAAAITVEFVGGPLGRRREIEFEIGSDLPSRTDECLEAGVSPQLIGTRRRHYWGQAQAHRCHRSAHRTKATHRCAAEPRPPRWRLHHRNASRDAALALGACRYSSALKRPISGVIRPAVDRERLSGDEIAVGGGQKHQRAQQVLRIFVALDRAANERRRL